MPTQSKLLHQNAAEQQQHPQTNAVGKTKQHRKSSKNEGGATDDSLNTSSIMNPEKCNTKRPTSTGSSLQDCKNCATQDKSNSENQQPSSSTSYHEFTRANNNNSNNTIPHMNGNRRGDVGQSPNHTNHFYNRFFDTMSMKRKYFELFIIKSEGNSLTRYEFTPKLTDETTRKRLPPSRLVDCDCKIFVDDYGPFTREYYRRLINKKIKLWECSEDDSLIGPGYCSQIHLTEQLHNDKGFFTPFHRVILPRVREFPRLETVFVRCNEIEIKSRVSICGSEVHKFMGQIVQLSNGLFSAITTLDMRVEVPCMVRYELKTDINDDNSTEGSTFLQPCTRLSEPFNGFVLVERICKSGQKAFSDCEVVPQHWIVDSKSSNGKENTKPSRSPPKCTVSPNIAAKKKPAALQKSPKCGLKSKTKCPVEGCTQQIHTQSGKTCMKHHEGPKKYCPKCPVNGKKRISQRKGGLCKVCYKEKHSE